MPLGNAIAALDEVHGREAIDTSAERGCIFRLLRDYGYSSSLPQVEHLAPPVPAGLLLRASSGPEALHSLRRLTDLSGAFFPTLGLKLIGEGHRTIPRDVFDDVGASLHAYHAFAVCHRDLGLFKDTHPYPLYSRR
jgi:hypothetical protein